MKADDIEQAIIIGARLRVARRTLGLTQGDVGETMGLSSSSIGAMERGDRGITGVELRHLSRLLRRSVAWLLGETEPPDDPALTQAVAHLTPNDRDLLLNYARFLKHQQNGASA